jgi:hypothetical protein
MPLPVKLIRTSDLLLRGRTMGAVTKLAGSSGHPPSEKAEVFDLNFLPKHLTRQCRSLIEGYHEVHGFTCLPDILWKFRLGPFIEKHRDLRLCLKKASTTRSAKKSNEGFTQIATTILSLEILASRFAGWSAIYPDEGAMANAILKRNSRSPHMALMEFYLYPPKYISSAAIATLAPPPNREQSGAELYRKSRPELPGERLALNYIRAVQQTTDDGSRRSTAKASPA